VDLDPRFDKCEVENLFAAPLLRVEWRDIESLNEELKALILEKSKTIDSVKQSNKGGWQSQKDLQHWTCACIERFLGMVNFGAVKVLSSCIDENTVSLLKRRWTIIAWANVNRYSHYNGLHNHAGGFWSGVYYVSSGEPKDHSSQEGSISFRNPTLAPLAMRNLRPPAPLEEIFKTSYTVKPLNGLMLLFPSWLEHYVHPYFGEEPRISISWDISM
jgi:uncharacterized protein (TIGR02466 family)